MQGIAVCGSSMTLCLLFGMLSEAFDESYYSCIMTGTPSSHNDSCYSSELTA